MGIYGGGIKNMESEALIRAREYEKEEGDRIPDRDRPVYHLTPLAGWLNDPNGFSYYQGEYHLFYQYYPFAAEWGPMHWGHAVTKDLLSWEYRPAALAPDCSYDEEGCWSGSALTLPDGRQLLVYTGREPFTNEGQREICQVQCLAVGDGTNYEKWPDNPVLTGKDLPEGSSIYDFRDPKAWKDEKSGLYYMVAVNRAADGHGQALLYESQDGFSWQFENVLDASHGRLGSMWECPDFFELDGKTILLVSPQAMKQEGEFLNYHGNAYLIGSYDADTRTFTREAAHALDFGYDFYAATTTEGPDGRRILVAWMQAWENVKGRSYPLGWAGMMTVPRELSVKDGHLFQNPVRELLARRQNPVNYRQVSVTGPLSLKGVSGRSLDMIVHIGPGQDSDYSAFEIRFAEGEIGGQYYGTVLRYEKEKGLIRLDRSMSGYADDLMPARVLKLEVEEGGQGRGEDLSIRILLDRFSAEIFINDGRYSLSSLLETGQEADGISFLAEGQAVIDVEKYEIR